MECKDFTLHHCLDSIDDMIELIEKDTPIGREVLSKAFFTTNQSELIKSLNWNSYETNLAAFKMDTTFITSDQVSDIISVKNARPKM